MVFSYLLFKSRYIPQALAAWGVFSSLVLAVVTVAIMVFPDLAGVVTENRVWTPPTLVGTTLYVRDRRTLAAFDLSAQGS